MQTSHEKIHSLLSKFNTALLVTTGLDGVQHARPMGVVKLEPNCEVWFFTARDSEKTREIQQNQQVLLAFQDGHTCSVSLTGQAELVSDRQQITALWKESYKVWFPQGANDPTLLLIKVTPVGGEYWDATGFQGIKYLLKTAQAYLSGTTPVIDREQHAQVTL